MKITAKDYKKQKIKSYIKDQNLFFFINNNNSNDWILTEKELKKLNLNYYKILNKLAKKTLESSVYKNNSNSINGSTLFIKPSITKISKNILINNFEQLFFTLISVKLNNKIYTANQLKNMYSLSYKKNTLLLYQFMITNLKFYCVNPINKKLSK